MLGLRGGAMEAEMSDIDRKRIEAVKKLERMGYEWFEGKWRDGDMSDFQEDILEEVGQDAYDTFGSALEYVGEIEGIVTLSVPSSFQKYWVETEYMEALRNVLSRQHKDLNSIEIIVFGDLGTSKERLIKLLEGMKD
jgi:hypothetical protein